MVAINEIRVGMGVFSADDSRIGTVYNVETDRITLLGDPDSSYADGHYYAAIILIASVSEGRIILLEDAEAALILQEAYSEALPGGEGSERGRSAGEASVAAPGFGDRRGPSTAVLLALALAGAMAGAAIAFMFRSRKQAETRPQRAGEAATTRFGMEEVDDSEIPATGGPTADDLGRWGSGGGS